MNKVLPTSVLAQQQRDLLHAIFTIKNIASKGTNTLAIGVNNTLNTNLNAYSSTYPLRGLQTYQANAAASALRSLQTTYPVLAQLIGDVAFEHLAHDFWAKHPPTRGDLAQWGGELTVFIASIATLQTEPYLSDVAKVEWAMHTCATATDRTTDVTTFALLTEQDPDALTLQLAPGTALVHSHYPIASLLTAHLYATSSFAEVGEKLRQNTPEIALVWRHGLRPMVSSCTFGEAAFISQLLSGKSLLAALVSAAGCESDNFDFNTWLSLSVKNGLLLGAQWL